MTEQTNPPVPTKEELAQNLLSRAAVLRDQAAQYRKSKDVMVERNRRMVEELEAEIAYNNLEADYKIQKSERDAQTLTNKAHELLREIEAEKQGANNEPQS